MSSMSNFPPNVVESVKIFDDIVRKNVSYKIPSSKEVKVVIVPLEVSLPLLSDTSFFEFRQWFIKFEVIAKNKSLTRDEIGSTLLEHVPRYRSISVDDILESPDIETIQDIQIKLALEFFGYKLIYRITRYAINIPDGLFIRDIVKEFIDRCEALYLISVILEVECPVNKISLTSALLDALPPYLLEKLFDIYSKSEEASFKDRINLLLMGSHTYTVERQPMGPVLL